MQAFSTPSRPPRAATAARGREAWARPEGGPKKRLRKGSRRGRTQPKQPAGEDRKPIARGGGFPDERFSPTALYASCPAYEPAEERPAHDGGARRIQRSCSATGGIPCEMSLSRTVCS
jgi:hypothetical protein